MTRGRTVRQQPRQAPQQPLLPEHGRHRQQPGQRQRRQQQKACPSAGDVPRGDEGENQPVDRQRQKAGQAVGHDRGGGVDGARAVAADVGHAIDVAADGRGQEEVEEGAGQMAGEEAPQGLADAVGRQQQSAT